MSPTQRRSLVLMGIAIGWLPAADGLAQSTPQDPFSEEIPDASLPNQVPTDNSQDGEIYGSPAAKDLVREARKFDGMFCPRDQSDRVRAALLYERAIDAQPGAKINAQLGNRIAQMYAFNADPERNITTNPETARWWWIHCLELTNPRQLLWAQAQMGLHRYDEILKLDANQVELDDWRVWPQGDSAQAAGFRQRERDRVRRHLADLQARVAVKKAHLEMQRAAQGKPVSATPQPSASAAEKSSACSMPSRRCLNPRLFRKRCR